MRLNEFESALEDCNKAIEIKKDYAKVSKHAASALIVILVVVP